ncbi:MAG: 50S ribosomal protein L15 [Gammaproteobacteria bacterium]|jgi:large subunit ribosomal protein L15|nr:50S ribosomal protein L15 [Gammaproteobacteria bacterium]
MDLNHLQPSAGSKPKKLRVGRGFTRGKTAGRGHKGQKSRSGGKVRVGFEGGQMPLYIRLPKVGFSSRLAQVTKCLRLSEINAVKKMVPEVEEINLAVLFAAGLISSQTKFVKVFASGEVSEKLILSGIRVSKGAKEAIEAAGGSVLEASR